MDRMERYSIADGNQIHDMDTDKIVGAGMFNDDAVRICAALNFVEDFQRDGAVKFRDMPDMLLRAEWATYAAAALTGLATKEAGTVASDAKCAANYADAMMAEADRRFSHDDQ